MTKLDKVIIQDLTVTWIKDRWFPLLFTLFNLYLMYLHIKAECVFNTWTGSFVS